MQLTAERVVQGRQGAEAACRAARRLGRCAAREAPLVLRAQARHDEARPLAAWVLAGPALLVIVVFFALPVVAGLALSLTDFDLYALADLVDPALRRPAELRRSCCRRRCSGRRWATRCTSSSSACRCRSACRSARALLLDSRFARWQRFFRTVAVRAGGHDRRGRGGHLALPAAHALRAASTRASRRSACAPIDWLGDPHWSMPAIILFAAWKNFGYNMIILLAALQAVPRELYEAARIDGAGALRRFADVTLPMLVPTLVLVGIMTVSGYFQLFAEPYVMTQGGPLRSTVSVLYLMYEEGFRWWNLGNASRGGVPALRRDLLRQLGACCASTATRRGGDEPAARRLARQRPARRARGARPCFPLLWMVSASFMPPGASSTLPTPILPPSPTLENYRTLFGSVGMGRYLLNSLLIAALATAISVTFNLMAGYAFAKLRFRGRDAIFRAAARRAGDPGAGGDAAAVPDAQAAGPDQQLRRRDRAGDGEHLRHLSRAPVRAAASPTSCSRRRASTAPASCASSRPWSSRCSSPSLATLAVFSFLAAWNDFMWPLIVLTDDALHTLPVALAGLSREHVQDNELMMAGSVVTVLPVLVLFLALQRQYMEGLMAGSVKG